MFFPPRASSLLLPVAVTWRNFLGVSFSKVLSPTNCGETHRICRDQGRSMTTVAIFFPPSFALIQLLTVAFLYPTDSFSCTRAKSFLPAGRQKKILPRGKIL